MKRWCTIQEHNAKRAGLHWDLRFENNGVLESWVLPRASLPEGDTKFLAIKVNDHDWDYRNFEGVIESGYGAGTVKLIHAGEVEVLEYRDTKVKFKYTDKTYNLHTMRGNKWLIYEV